MEEIADTLNQFCDQQPFHTGWFLKHMPTGRSVSRHGSVVVPSASTRKVAIMMAAFAAARDGRLNLDQPVEIDAEHQKTDWGCFQFLKPGFSITLRDAVILMIIISDNTCTGIVADLVGLDTVNRLCSSIGMKGTTHRHGIPTPGLGTFRPLEAVNTTTPDDMGLLLDRIAQGTTDLAAAKTLGCIPDDCIEALQIMSWQRLRDRLPSQLPYRTKIAHKTGTSTSLQNFNDVGIVYFDETPLFILTAYTDEVPLELTDGTPGHSAAMKLIGSLSRCCYDALTPPERRD